MNNPNINLRNKVLNIRCNYCGNINKIKPKEEIVCKYCKKAINVDISECFDVNIQSEEYYLFQLKAAIINHDDEKIEEFKEKLKMLESHDDIYMHIINRRALKNFEKEENVDFVVEYLILQNKNYTYEDKLKQIKKIENKEKYLNLLKDETENQELVDNLYEEKEEMKAYDVVKDNHMKFFFLFLGLFVLTSVLIRLFAEFIFPEEVLFASIIVVSIIPAEFFTISMMKIIKFKSQFLKFLIIISMLCVSFVLISYILTIHLSNGNVNIYFDHLIHVFKEINDAMNANYDGE